ncbi:MAG: hypothetical protein HN348_30380 [Proteobacteria bacterium]|jgi:hypothetical protein|nr:hypothetical protein [Pseudomonadota bacterium]
MCSDGNIFQPPDLDSSCGKYFTFRDLIECGETWHHHADGGRTISNLPLQLQTWDGLRLLATKVLDPVVERFGPMCLTYGFASSNLTRHIRRGIDVRRDQHAGSEINRVGNLVCSRLGQAADFQLPNTSSVDVAIFVAEKLPFDRIYLYGPKRPLHVSVGPCPAQLIVELVETGGHRHPKKTWKRGDFLSAFG